MKKVILSIILLIGFIFNTGCSKYIEVPIYIESTCPKIEVLKIIPRIDVTVSEDGAIRDTSMYNLINGAKQLRKTEAYYYEQVTKYNKEFTTVDNADK